MWQDVVSRGWGKGKGELLFHGYRVSLWGDDRFGMDSGDSCITMYLYLMYLNFLFYIFYHSKKNQQIFLNLRVSLNCFFTSLVHFLLIMENCWSFNNLGYIYIYIYLKLAFCLSCMLQIYLPSLLTFDFEAFFLPINF